MPFSLEWIDHRYAFLASPICMGNRLVNWAWVELEGLFPYDLFDIFFSERWLLEIEAERGGADWFIIYLMKGCQVRVAQSLINCDVKGKITRSVSFHEVLLLLIVKGQTCCPHEYLHRRSM
jgi:hypothetical protein